MQRLNISFLPKFKTYLVKDIFTAFSPNSTGLRQCSHPKVSIKSKGKQDFFQQSCSSIVYNFIKRSISTQGFSCQSCKTFRNTCFAEQTCVVFYPAIAEKLVATIAEAYLEPCQKSKIQLFAKIVNGWKLYPRSLTGSQAATQRCS